MAKPQTEDGFVMIALDLFPAILSAGLSGYAQIVLAEVLLLWAGPRKKHRIYLHGSELAALTGLERNNARRAIRELVDANILRESGDGYLFNKDYDSWTPKGGPLGERLDGRMAGWIKGSVGRCGAPQKHKRTNKNSESIQTPKQLSDESIQTPKQLSDESIQTPKQLSDESIQTPKQLSDESIQTQRRSTPLEPPIEEPARQKNLELREEELRAEKQAAPHANGRPLYDLPYPGEDDLLAVVGNGPHRIGDDEARTIWLSIWREWHNERLCREWHNEQRSYSADTWRTALEETKRRGSIPRTIRYVKTIAADVEAGRLPGGRETPRRTPAAKPKSEAQAKRERLLEWANSKDDEDEEGDES